MFRRINKVYETIRVDSDRDGYLEAIQQLFWVLDTAVVTMGSIQKGDHGYTAHHGRVRHTVTLDVDI